MNLLRRLLGRREEPDEVTPEIAEQKVKSDATLERVRRLAGDERVTVAVRGTADAIRDARRPR
jgi:hypothetical protein